MTDYRHTWSSFVSVLLLLSTGCEEGGFTPSTGTDGGVRPPPVHTDGGIPDSGMGAEPPDPLEATLNQLGVDTSDSPRLDDNSEPLPDSYLPLGGSFPLNRTTELFLAGVSLGDPTMPGTFDGLDSEVAFIRTEEETGVLHEEDSPEPSWAVHQTRDRDFSRTTRAAALADIDGDGREETVVAYSTESADRELRLTIFEDAEPHPALRYDRSTGASQHGSDSGSCRGGQRRRWRRLPRSGRWSNERRRRQAAVHHGFDRDTNGSPNPAARGANLRRRLGMGAAARLRAVRLRSGDRTGGGPQRIGYRFFRRHHQLLRASDLR